VHRLAEILASTDKHGEQYQDGGCVLAIQSINQIVVEVILEVAEVDSGLDQTVHPGASDDDVAENLNTCHLCSYQSLT